MLDVDSGSLMLTGTLGSLLETRAARDEKAPFALFSQASAVTASELNSLANRVAERLLERGLQTGSRIALLATVGPVQQAALTAGWKIGAVVSTADPFVEPLGLVRFLDQFAPKLVLLDPAHPRASAFRDLCASTDRPVLELHPGEWDDADNPQANVSPDDIAVCAYTSGSTGNPKGVLLSHKNLLSGASNVRDAKGLTASDRVLCVLPLSHLNGLATTFVTPLLSGGSTLFLQGPFNPREALGLISQYECSWFSAVPTHYATLMFPPVDKASWSLDTLRFCRSASAPLSPRLLREFEEHYGVPIIETMGMTETAGQVFSNPMPPVERKTGSVGLPLGFEVRIVDEDGGECGKDTIGEIQFRGPAVTPGYLGDPDETSEAFDGTWLKSGDLGEFDSDGFYYIRGRKKNIAIFAGINISLRSLEMEVQETGIVREVACVGEAHETFGEVITAYAVRRGSDDDLPRVAEQITKILQPLLPSRQALNSVRFVADMPRSSVGKVLKGLLKNVEVTWDSYTPLAADAGSLLADVLGIPADQIREGLNPEIENRWDSLAHVALIVAVETALNRDLSSAEMTAISSYQGLVQVLDRSLPTTAQTDNSDGDIRIEAIRSKDLYDFAVRTLDSSKHGDLIPITRNRALAFANNPYADENDIGMLIAYNKDQCVGYRGLLSGLLKKGDEFSKVIWTSAMYVPPEFRNKSVAAMLMLKAFELGDVASGGISQEAEPVYRGLGARDLGSLDYYVFNFDRMNVFTLPVRLVRKTLSKLGVKTELTGGISAARRVYKPFESLLYALLTRRYDKQLKEISYREVDEISEHSTCSQREGGPAVFYRGADAINWMLRFKWVMRPYEVSELEATAYFPGIRDFFKFIPVEIFSADGNEYKGFAVFSVSTRGSKTEIKVLDHHLCDKDDHKYILYIALRYARAYGAQRTILPEKVAKPLMGSPITRNLLHKEHLTYLYHPKGFDSPLSLSSDNIELEFHDGDMAFT